MNALAAMSNQELTNTSSMYIHYWELSHYNNGQHVGRFFDLEGVTEDEHQTEIAEWLEEVSKASGELCEEIIVGDAEGIPREYLGEWSIDSGFFEFNEFLSSTHLEQEAVEAGLYLDIPLESLEDAYQGCWSSDEDFAEEQADSCGLLDNATSWPLNCIDWEMAARELMYDYSEHDGHYFSDNY
mgnify:CR=1 FL=1